VAFFAVAFFAVAFFAVAFFAVTFLAETFLTVAIAAGIVHCLFRAGPLVSLITSFKDASGKRQSRNACQDFAACPQSSRSSQGGLP
jgi:hypothetical protein